MYEVEDRVYFFCKNTWLYSDFIVKEIVPGLNRPLKLKCEDCGYSTWANEKEIEDCGVWKILILL